MKEEDFLQIFKSGFHKLILKKVKLLKKCKTKTGREYFVFKGLFSFIPPEQVWMDDTPIDYDFLKSLLKKFGEETSNCINRKFTKKVIKNGKTVDKQTFVYVFDVIPKNIYKFRFDREKKIMYLVVKGYGLFQ